MHFVTQQQILKHTHIEPSEKSRIERNQQLLQIAYIFMRKAERDLPKEERMALRKERQEKKEQEQKRLEELEK